MLIVPDINIQQVQKAICGDFYTWSSNERGLFRLTDTDAVFYGITLMYPGDGGGLYVYDGERRLVWTMLTTFTGSFVVNGYCKGGIIVDNGYGRSMGANISITWRE